MSRTLVLVVTSLLAATAGAQTSAESITVQTDERGSRLLVGGRPLLVKGMNWDYVPVGENYAYSLWERPAAEIQKVLERDMALLRDMHVNVIRVYVGMPKQWIRFIHEKFGIYTVLNHTVGRYGLTIDGAFRSVTDYSSKAVRAQLRGELKELVTSYKDTPGILMWLLGNENNYGLYWESAEISNLPVGQQQDARAEAMYSLFGEIISDIKAIDPAHPVAMANGDLQFIDLIAKHCKELDVMGANVYRGRSSGDLFDKVWQKLRLPFLYTEFGADAYDAKLLREDGLTQASYLRDLWRELEENTHGKGLAGNAIGGFIFQWSDGWWKYKQDTNLDIQDNTASWANGGYPEDFVEGANNMNEEWWGIMSKGPTPAGELSPLHPRAAYFLLRDGLRLDPYAEGITLDSVRDAWNALDPRAYARTAAADRAVDLGEVLATRVRVSDAVLELSTFTTGGSRLIEPNRMLTRFGHTESAFFGLEVTPTPNVRGRVVVNLLGFVADNPIDEIFFERRGGGAVPGANSLKLYQGSFEWRESWFELSGFYREGHYHWGYEGDFFALYPEANYQRAVDTFNADAPSGVVFTGKQLLEGLKVAFGPELYWGANPALIAKYNRVVGPFEFAVMHQQDIAQRSAAGTSSALPVPQTAKTTVYAAVKTGDVKVEWGGIVAGYDRLGRAFQVAEAIDGPSYLGSGYRVLDDTIRWYDMLGTKAKVTWTGGKVNLYGQAGYRGIVADSLPDQTITLAGFRLKESGQGNHWHAIAGGTFNVTSAFQIAPNFIYQRPLVGPLPSIRDAYDPSSGTYFPGTVPRNQLRDPFWVRSNRELLGAELMLVFDPTPETWFWQWNNAQKENAPFAASLTFVYKHQPTIMDSGIGVLGNGTFFAFPGSTPPQDIWEVWARFVVHSGAVHLAGSAWLGTGQANGNNARLVTRGGVEARMDVGRFTFSGFVKIADWGPFDYHRDFNLTFPLQVNGDFTYTLDLPRWFFPNQTKIGLLAKVRLLDQNSPRVDPTVNANNLGSEWEARTYVRFSL